MNKQSINDSIIFLFKILTYFIFLYTFLIVMQRVNFSIMDRTRTAVVTISSFVLVLLMMQSVYGNFEIGHRKSKPVFLSTMISLLFADFVATVAMIVMGSIQYSPKAIVLPSLFYLIITIILQAMICWVLAHIGNDLYFRLFDPQKIIIINRDEHLFKKVNNYIKNHDKQYDVFDIHNSLDISQLDEAQTIFALGLSSVEEKMLLEHSYKNDKSVIYSASQHNFLVARKNTIVIDDILMIEATPKCPTLFQLTLKRLMDIAGALVLLLISIPIYIVVGIAIKLEDKGPILFTQDRLTKNGRIFKIYKFRSMVVDSSDVSATVDDDRITKVGKIIRKLRIDELPQAMNILIGDISLVGPRPE
ncbi:MAG: hypothetical protein GX038_06665, partial [Erysipelothrix sp.]|nr:hypothetical protein [Erysipelothrix sp.]